MEEKYSGSVYESSELVSDLQAMGVDPTVLLDSTLTEAGFIPQYDSEGNIINAGWTTTVGDFPKEYYGAFGFYGPGGQPIVYDEELGNWVLKVNDDENWTTIRVPLGPETVDQFNDALKNFNMRDFGNSPSYSFVINNDNSISLTSSYDVDFITLDVMNGVYNGELSFGLSDSNQYTCSVDELTEYFKKKYPEYDNATIKAIVYNHCGKVRNGVVYIDPVDLDKFSIDDFAPPINSNPEYVEMVITQDTVDKYFPLHTSTNAWVTPDELFFTCFDDYPEVDRDINNLSPEEKRIIAEKGYFVVDGHIQTCSFAFTPGVNLHYNDDGTYTLKFSLNEPFVDDMLFYMNMEDYYDFLDNNYNRDVTNRRNLNLAKFLDAKFNLSGLSVSTVDSQGRYVYYDNVTDQLNSNYVISYNGFPLHFQNGGNTNDKSLSENIDLYIRDVVMSDTVSVNNLGFAMSVLIDDKTGELSENYLYVDSNGEKHTLSEQGYSKIEQLPDGSYKIYLTNGQGYVISMNDAVPLGNGEIQASVPSIIKNVNGSTAMQNLNIQNYLTSQTAFQGMDIDVRATDDVYKIYVNGKLYEVKRESVEKYDENGNLILSTDELNREIFKEVNGQLPENSGSIESYMMKYFNLNSVDNIDVELVGDTYNINIDGKIYSVKKDDLYAGGSSNGVDEYTPEELAHAIFNSISDELPNEYIYSASRYSYISTNMLNPIIDMTNSQYYEDLCSDLLKMDEKLMDYKSDIVKISISDPNFTEFNDDISSYANSIEDVADECVKLSKKIEHCVNYIKDFDKSLQTTLDNYINEFFDEVTTEKVIRTADKAPTVDTQKYVEFFTKKTEEAKEVLKLYELYGDGFIQITAETMNDMQSKNNNAYEIRTEEINGQIFYFTTVDALSSYVSKEHSVYFNDDYSIYNWAGEQLGKSIGNAEHTDIITGEEAAKMADVELMSSYIMCSGSYYLHLLENEKMKKNLECFVNTQPYLDKIFTDEYSQLLKDISKGDSSTYNENFVGAPEYFTDTQKALFYLVSEEYLTILNDEIKKSREEYEKNIKVNPNYASGPSIKYVEMQESIDAVKKSLESLVPYEYAQVEGYNEAIKEIKDWLADGNASLSDYWTYLAGKFGEGFIETPADMLYIVFPDMELNSSDYKYKYMSEFLSSASGLSTSEIKKECDAGNVSVLEKQLKERVVETNSGTKLEMVGMYGDWSQAAGSMVFEVLLDNLCSPAVSAAVKALSKAGATIHDSRENGYSYAASYMAGLFVGAVTGAFEYEPFKDKMKELFTYEMFGIKTTAFDGKMSTQLYENEVKQIFPSLFGESMKRWDAADVELFNKLIMTEDVDGMVAFIGKMGKDVPFTAQALKGVDKLLGYSLNAGRSMLNGKAVDSIATAGQNGIYYADNVINGTNNEYEDVGIIKIDNTVSDIQEDGGMYWLNTAWKNYVHDGGKDILKFLVEKCVE